MTLANFRGRAVRGTRAFTLIELLLVIGIIGVLIAVGLALGNKVTAGGRNRLTQDAIRVLDQSLTEYNAVKAGSPPAYVADPIKTTVTKTWYIPIADGMSTAPKSETVNSVGWYLYQVGSADSSDGVTSVDAILKGLNPKLLKTNLSFPDASGAGGPAEGQQKQAVPNQFRTVVDAYGRDLRYVHPSFDGVVEEPTNTWELAGDVDAKARAYSITKLRRDPKKKDADGGYCQSGRAYFYSTGLDGDPSTVDDNVYTTKPTFKKD